MCYANQSNKNSLIFVSNEQRPQNEIINFIVPQFSHFNLQVIVFFISQRRLESELELTLPQSSLLAKSILIDGCYLVAGNDKIYHVPKNNTSESDDHSWPLFKENILAIIIGIALQHLYPSTDSVNHQSLLHDHTQA